ncbi:MAG: DUF4215 domain-containing protein [Deltaproteobacteria bacterium]|nr:DUF4215 domain-containing protein [Deltaproteobacteria bacterium]
MRRASTAVLATAMLATLLACAPGKGRDDPCGGTDLPAETPESTPADLPPEPSPVPEPEPEPEPDVPPDPAPDLAPDPAPEPGPDVPPCTPAAESCNGKDDDCDGVTDGPGDGLPGCTPRFADRDGDGHGDPGDERCLCAPVPPHFATAGDDCDDGDPGIPSPTSGCDGGCPDGQTTGTEACDDGNGFPWDGCDACKKRGFVAAAQSDHADPAIATSGDRLAVVFTADGYTRNVYAQVFDLSGPKLTKVGAEVALGGGHFLPGGEQLQGGGSVAGLANGRFIAAWDAWGLDGDDFGVFLATFTSNGVDSRSTANEHWQARQLAPAVAARATGGLVAWQGWDDGGSGYDVYARPFGTWGDPSSPEVRLNEFWAGDQERPDVVALTDGGFAVAWLSDLQADGKPAIVVRGFADDSAPISAEVVLPVGRSAGRPSLAALGAKRILVAWDSQESWEVRPQVRHAVVDLSAPGPVAVAEVPPVPDAPWYVTGAGTAGVAAIPGKGFAIAYEAWQHRWIRARGFTEAGEVAWERDVSPAHDGLGGWGDMGASPAATFLPDGRLAIAWVCTFSSGHPTHGTCLSALTVPFTPSP